MFPKFTGSLIIKLLSVCFLLLSVPATSFTGLVSLHWVVEIDFGRLNQNIIDNKNLK